MTTINDVLQLHTTPESKLCILAMKLCRKDKLHLQHLSDLTGMDVAEVSQAAQNLKGMGINKSKDFNSIVLDKEWVITDGKSLQEWS